MKDKVIFENEEEAYEVCSKLSGSNNWKSDLLILKKHGYIRKSAVEEAEEMYKRNFDNGDYIPSNLAEKLYEAIQYLKAENEALKK